LILEAVNKFWQMVSKSTQLFYS